MNRSSVQSSVGSDSFWPHESQYTRPPCSSPAPGVRSNSHPLSQWCHPDFSSSVVPFSSCPQSLPASASFPMSQLFAWGGQATGVSALASFLPQNTQGWSPSEWTGLDLLAVQGTLKSLLQHHCLKASMLSNLLFNFFSCTFCVSTAVLGTLLLLSCSVVSNSATQWTVTHHATSVHGILHAGSWQNSSTLTTSC